mgnify:CR=1 FL=1
MVWVCKKHGENCRSYVETIASDFNSMKIKPEQLVEIIKNSPEDKKIIEMIEWKEKVKT